MNGIGQYFGAAPPESPGADIGRQAPVDPVSAAGAASLMAREAAQALAYRCVQGVLAYPAVLFTTVFVVPGETRRLMFVVPCGLLLLLVVGVRLTAMLPFDSRYPPNPDRWRRHFHAASFLSMTRSWLCTAAPAKRSFPETSTRSDRRRTLRNWMPRLTKAPAVAAGRGKFGTFARMAASSRSRSRLRWSAIGRAAPSPRLA